MRTAVVTGGSSGIGLAIARLLVLRGTWRLLLAARESARLRDAAAELGAEAVPCDVTDAVAVEQLAAASAGAGGCDLLVHSAGIPARACLAEADVDEYRRVMETNYVGTVAVTQALWAQVAERRGRMAVIVSVAGAASFGSSAAYAASKHAQLAYARGLASAGRRHGVAVTVVNPGPVATPGFPQGRLRRLPVVRRLVLEPDTCARMTMRAVDRGALEAFIPPAYRAATILEGLAPGLSVRLAAAVRRPRGGQVDLPSPERA